MEEPERRTTKELSPEIIYDLVARVGFRKAFHLGAMNATKELAGLCHIGRNKCVLDIGCGTGKTACYIALTYGCRVVGIDISQRMVNKSNERAKREGVEDKVQFRVGDAQSLPFEDSVFDVVIGEFITGLLQDKGGAAEEYLRVTKPGGWVALNEATWIKTPPPTELVQYLSHTYGIKGEILTSDGWKQLMEGAGLRDVVARSYKVKALSNKWEDLTDSLRVWHKVLYLFITSAAFRRFIKEALSLPKNLLEYFGYGIYAGRKQEG